MMGISNSTSTVPEPAPETWLQQMDCIPIDDHSLPAESVFSAQIHQGGEPEKTAPSYIP